MQSRIYELLTSLVLGFSLVGCADPFREKLVQALNDSKLEPRDISCFGGTVFQTFLSRSRAGYCLINLDGGEVNALTQKMGFETQQGTIHSNSNSVCERMKGFELSGPKVTRYGRNKEASRNSNENPRIESIYFNSSTSEACVDIHYPYG